MGPESSTTTILPFDSTATWVPNAPLPPGPGISTCSARTVNDVARTQNTTAANAARKGEKPLFLASGTPAPVRIKLAGAHVSGPKEDVLRIAELLHRYTGETRNAVFRRFAS